MPCLPPSRTAASRLASQMSSLSPALPPLCLPTLRAARRRGTVGRPPRSRSAASVAAASALPSDAPPYP
eukprot:6193545-Pleurochrysis_carterae.AAC.1